MAVRDGAETSGFEKNDWIIFSRRRCPKGQIQDVFDTSLYIKPSSFTANHNHFAIGINIMAVRDGAETSGFEKNDWIIFSRRRRPKGQIQEVFDTSLYIKPSPHPPIITILPLALILWQFETVPKPLGLNFLLGTKNDAESARRDKCRKHLVKNSSIINFHAAGARRVKYRMYLIHPSI